MKGIWIAVVVLAGGGATLKWLASSTAAAETAVSADATSAAKRGTLEIAVSETGYLKAKNSVNLQPQFEGEGVITLLAKEGKQVEAGEVLVEFDKTELETQLDEFTNDLIQYSAELEAARAEYEIQRRESEAAVEKAEFELQVARMKLEMYEKGEMPNELRKKRLASEKAHSELARAKERFEKVPELRQQGFLTKIQEEEERIQVREKEIELENADKDLELYETYTDPMQRAERKNAVRDGERALTNAREKADISLKEKKYLITTTDNRVKSTEARIAKRRKELGFMTIRAPRAGIVYYGDPAEPWNHGDIKLGARIQQGVTVITLPDLKEMQVLIRVHEAEIDLVKLEHPAVVTLEAVKDRTFPAKVTRIAAVASSNWGNPENKTFEVEITMDPLDIELRAGTTARAEIHVETLEDALHVPIQAVFVEGAEHFAFLRSGAGCERRAVKIGKNNNHFVQVLDGLKEGERVLLYDPRTAGVGETKEGTGATESAPSAPSATDAVSAAATAASSGG